MGCVPSKKCVEPNVIKQVVEKPTTVASILEAVPVLLKKIPTDVLRTNLLPYLLNSFEPDALPVKPVYDNPRRAVYDILRKYYSYSEEIIYLRSKYNPIDTVETLYMIYLPSNNETRRIAVKDYLKCGKKKDDTYFSYMWDISNVTDMSFLFSGHTDFNYGNEAHIGRKFIKWDTYNVVMPYRPEIAALYEISYYKGNKMRY